LERRLQSAFWFQAREGRETLCISACVRVLYLDDSEGLVRESERKREKSLSVELMRGEKKKIINKSYKVLQ
jgi:hypothetical protein